MYVSSKVGPVSSAVVTMARKNLKNTKIGLKLNKNKWKTKRKKKNKQKKLLKQKKYFFH